MLIEIKVALNFLLSYLYDKLPRRRVNLFGDEIEKYLKHKLTISDNKSGESFHLVIKINKRINYIDQCVVEAAKESAMNLEEIVEQLPVYLKIFIFSGRVAYKQCNNTCISDEKNTKCKYCNGEVSLSDEKEEEETESLDTMVNADNFKFIYSSKSISEHPSSPSDNLNDASSKLNEFYQYLLNINSLNQQQNHMKATMSASFNLPYQNQMQPLVSIGKLPIKQNQQQNQSSQHINNSLSARNISPSNTSEQWPSPPSSSSSCSSSSSSTSSSSSSSSFSQATNQHFQLLKSFNNENMSLPVLPMYMSNNLASPTAPNGFYLNEFKAENNDAFDAINGEHRSFRALSYILGFFSVKISVLKAL